MFKKTKNKRGGGPETETDGTMNSRITKPHTYQEEALRAIDMPGPAQPTPRLRARIVSARPLQSASNGGDQFATSRPVLNLNALFRFTLTKSPSRPGGW